MAWLHNWAGLLICHLQVVSHETIACIDGKKLKRIVDRLTHSGMRVNESKTCRVKIFLS